MRNGKLLFCVLALMMGGCLPVMSLHSLYTKDDIKFDEKLLGTWVEDSNKPKLTWIFERVNTDEMKNWFEQADEPKNCYKLTVIDEKGEKGLFTTFLVKLGDDLFLDLWPAVLPCQPAADANEKEVKCAPYDVYGVNVYFFWPMHTFIKIDSIEPMLKLRLTDDENIEKLLKEHPDAVKCEEVDKRIVLTASTKELQQFVKKYMNDKNLFGKPITLKKLRNKIETTDPNQVTPEKK